MFVETNASPKGENHERVGELTIVAGAPVPDNRNVMTAWPFGPLLV
jgi:hypothetical protein